MTLIYDGGLPHFELRPGARVSAKLSGNALVLQAGYIGGPYYVLLDSILSVERPAAEILLIHWLSPQGSRVTLQLREQVKPNQTPRELTQLEYSLTRVLARRPQPDLPTNEVHTLFVKWLRDLHGLEFRNEVEVEMKVIAPLIYFLGYELRQVSLRVPVVIQAGQQQVEAVADWVLNSADSNEPLVVIEAKAPREPLNDRVLNQARSYAFALHAPYYLVVNGRELKLYELGTTGDFEIVSCALMELGNHWSELYRTIGSHREQEVNVSAPDGTTQASDEDHVESGGPVAGVGQHMLRDIFQQPSDGLSASLDSGGDRTSAIIIGCVVLLVLFSLLLFGCMAVVLMSVATS